VPPPYATTCALGLMLSTGTPNGWLAMIGDGAPPPVSAHMTVIHEASGPGWWYRSATVGPGPYVTVAQVAQGQTVHVYFAGDDEPYRTFRCWSTPDADGDCGVDSRDISWFLTDWLAGSGDYNVDFATDSADIPAFVADWLEGVG
jgi:hypothetical protein